MIQLWRYPRLLRFLHQFDRARNALWRGNVQSHQAEKNLAAFYEQVWREAAAQLGANIEPLGNDVFEIRLGSNSTRVIGNTSSLDDLVTHCLVRTKPLVYRLLSEQGLPIPSYLVVTRDQLASAIEFFDRLKGPCVVKPACGTGGGLGVITGIRSRWRLARAVWSAAAHGGDVLVEEQIEGDNYRLLYLDGKLIDAVVRHPPCVVGDGSSTVARLVEKLNADRLRPGADQAHVLLRVDMDMHNALAAQGLKISSVPKMGSRVVLKAAINENSSQDNVSAGDLLCEDIVQAGARAAMVTNTRLAGVDIITRDPTRPLQETGGVVLEVNSPPGYYWHYHKRNGSFPVALHVLEAIFAPCAQAVN